jgi:Mrp family chromosome partitioning ATPase
MTRFDSSLPEFADIVVSQWGASKLASNFFLRDVEGKLTFVVTPDNSRESRQSLGSLVRQRLGVYVDAEFAVATADELFDDSLKRAQDLRYFPVRGQLYSGKVGLVDRRLVGADWLRTPSDAAKKPARLVFASLKGGVGRSTALSVVASHWAQQGRRVLTIDMDLEAPGLGNMLLENAAVPEFGLLDYLVEKNLGPLDDQFFADMVGASWLGGGRGRVDVIPAIGQRSLANPENVLAKVARAYLPGDSEGDASFADHMRQMVDRFSDPLRYDVILVDARAGMHETTATAVLALGAEVLFFGVDQPQTFAGYRLLLSQLSTLPVNDRDDWRDRLTFVHARAGASEPQRKTFEEKIKLVFSECFHTGNPVTVPPDIHELKNTFAVDWADTGPTPDSDEEIQPAVCAILDDERFRDFDPLADTDSLSRQAYEVAFGQFIDVSSELASMDLAQD